MPWLLIEPKPYILFRVLIPWTRHCSSSSQTRERCSSLRESPPLPSSWTRPHSVADCAIVHQTNVTGCCSTTEQHANRHPDRELHHTLSHHYVTVHHSHHCASTNVVIAPCHCSDESVAPPSPFPAIVAPPILPRVSWKRVPFYFFRFVYFFYIRVIVLHFNEVFGWFLCCSFRYVYHLLFILLSLVALENVSIVGVQHLPLSFHFHASKFLILYFLRFCSSLCISNMLYICGLLFA